MPAIMVTEHPRSMDFMNQRKNYILRTVHKMAWMKIPPLVRNLQGSQPSEWQCRDVVNNFSLRLGRKRYKYWKCGRQAWKVTKCVEKFLMQKLKEIRKTTICTSATLQRECLREVFHNLQGPSAEWIQVGAPLKEAQIQQGRQGRSQGVCR